MSATAKPPSWSEVAVAAEQLASSDASAPTIPTMRRGDWVDHWKFGLCRIDRFDTAQPDRPAGQLVICTASSVRKTLRLEYVVVQSPRLDGERRIFPLLAKATGP